MLQIEREAIVGFSAQLADLLARILSIRNHSWGDAVAARHSCVDE